MSVCFARKLTDHNTYSFHSDVMSTMVCVPTCGSHTILCTYIRKQEKPVHTYQARKWYIDNVLRRFVVALFPDHSQILSRSRGEKSGNVASFIKCTWHTMAALIRTCCVYGSGFLDWSSRHKDTSCNHDGIHVHVRISAAIVCHVRFISEVVIYHCMKQVLSDSLT